MSLSSYIQTVRWLQLTEIVKRCLVSLFLILLHVTPDDDFLRRVHVGETRNVCHITVKCTRMS